MVGDLKTGTSKLWDHKLQMVVYDDHYIFLVDLVAFRAYTIQYNYTEIFANEYKYISIYIYI